MANHLSSMPWIIDTASPTVLYNGMMKQAQIEYVDYGNVAHHVEIQDRNGNIVARLKGTADLQTVRTGKIGWVYGLYVPLTDSDGVANMVSGKLIVYFG